ncbi:MAG: hypothetical protein FWE54_00095 [Methanimicrococcus sp.]|nr:hypothetical protein [Methanimicrococcus sp.]
MPHHTKRPPAFALHLACPPASARSFGGLRSVARPPARLPARRPARLSIRFRFVAYLSACSSARLLICLPACLSASVLPLIALATCNLPPAICHLQSATCNLPPAICHLQSATCNLPLPTALSTFICFFL